MFLNFLKVTLRTLYREKVYAIINIAGLSIAIACCVIIGIWLYGELTYDRHNSKYRQIYRVDNEWSVGENPITMAESPMLMGPILARDFPEIKAFARILRNGKMLIGYENDSFYWENVYSANNNIFKLFDHQAVYGDPSSALTEPKTAAVSETFAKKYFGDVNPIGKNIKTEKETYKIVLVFADLPENSHISYDVLLSELFIKVPDDPMAIAPLVDFPYCYTFLLMPEEYDIKDFDKISGSFYKNYIEGKAYLWKKSWLCPLTDIHYHSKISIVNEPTGNIFYIYGFAGVGIFILLVACINYVNMSTARIAKRAKEVGVRKILGSGKIFLILQFIGEAVLFSIISMFLGLMLVELVLNLTPVTQLLEKSISLDLINRPELLVWMIVFSVALGMVAGIYPALYLTSILPISAMIASIKAGKGNIYFRHMLVIIQFLISTGIIACAIIMYLQMQYCSHKSLGFNKDNKVLITLMGGKMADKVPLLKKELTKNRHILGAALSYHDLMGITVGGVSDVGNNENVPVPINMDIMEVDNDFVKVMGLEMVTGRDFSKRLITDTGVNYIANEALVKLQGWDQPLGKYVRAWTPGRIIGVIKDFHFSSLHDDIKPLVLKQDNRNHTESRTGGPTETTVYYLIVNIDGEDISGTLSYIEDRFEEFDQEHPLEFRFLDDALDHQYWTEQRLMKLIGIFSAVCIFISCLGLFGLAAFTTEQRTKEIGIRKVLGASTLQIITMLARNILVFILLGGIIASLAAYYTMDEWLTSFAYKIKIDPWVFLVSILIVAAVAFITVALQSLKAARANPVKALRYE